MDHENRHSDVININDTLYVANTVTGFEIYTLNSENSFFCGRTEG